MTKDALPSPPAEEPEASPIELRDEGTVERRVVALLREHQRLRAALHAGRMGTWEWHLADQRVVWSPTLEQIHGIPEGGFAGTFEAYQRDIHPEDRERVLAVLAAVPTGDHTDHHLEYRIVQPDGAVRWLEAHGHIERDETGAATHVMGVCTDITERKRLAEQRELAHARNVRLVAITAAIAAAVTEEQVHAAVVDQVGATLGASSAGLWILREDRRAELVRYVGYTAETASAISGLSIERAGHMPILDTLRTGEAVAIASQRDLVRDYPHLASLVSPHRRYRIACLPIYGDGEVIGGLGFTFEDAPPPDDAENHFLLLVAGYCAQAIERLKLLDAERRSRERAEVLYRLAAGLMGAVRIDELCATALDGLQCALGAGRASILTYDDAGVMRFRAWRGLTETYRRAVEGHSPWSRDVRAPEPIVVADVEADPEYAAFVPVFRAERIRGLVFIPLVADGRLIGKFMVYYEAPRPILPHELEMARAIANHVAAAFARFAATEQLERTVRFNEMFTGMLGHDLRNPLGAIVNGAQLVLMREENERVVKPVRRILSAGERMARMIDQLLDFTRIRVGAGVPLRRTTTDLRSLLREVQDEMESASPGWALAVHHHGDTIGAWDGDRLSQVFSNLLGNALHHGVPEHGCTVTVDGTMHDAVRVHVHNAGVVPEELVPRLFDPMTGTERRRQGSRGLGLGLFISRQILHAHGGSIEVTSTAEHGTTFTVILPRAEEHSP